LVTNSPLLKMFANLMASSEWTLASRRKVLSEVFTLLRVGLIHVKLPSSPFNSDTVFCSMGTTTGRVSFLVGVGFFIFSLTTPLDFCAFWPCIKWAGTNTKSIRIASDNLFMIIVPFF
jgi:hypothetical protein